MELVIGGAYQGKLTWSVRQKGFSQGDLFDLSEGFPSCAHPCFYHLEVLTRRACADGLDAEAILEKLSAHIENSVVISREIGCGIVPMDAFERSWREQHGRLLSMLASRAETATPWSRSAWPSTS